VNVERADKNADAGGLRYRNDDVLENRIVERMNFHGEGE
jgi:hypothetical protein